MKARYTPLRARFFVFGALAFTILAFAALAILINTIRRSVEQGDRTQTMSQAQLAKLYVETSMPGGWHEKDGYLYRGEARVAYGAVLRQALAPYIAPGTEILFLLGPPGEEALLEQKKGDLIQDLLPGAAEDLEAGRSSRSQAERARLRSDRPFATELGAGVVVRDDDGRVVGWILVANRTARDGDRNRSYVLWAFIVLGSAVILMIAGFSVLLLRLTKPIDRIAVERELARARNLELALLSETDPLTGLRNRRGLEAALSAMVRAGISPSHVALLDVDHFKLINDGRGHDEGDRVLKGIACILMSSVRNVDLCSHWGGEEFVVAFRELGDDHAAASAERIRTAIAAHSFGTGNSPLGVTVTIGIAALGDRGFGEALRRADEAMYRGKREGRNRVVVG